MSKRFLANAALFFLLWGFSSVTSFLLLVPANQQRFDFYPHWVGARTALQGDTPYTDAVTRQIQLGMFGRELTPEEDQQRFAYTPLIAVLMLPLWLLPFPLAVSLWLGLQFLLLILTPLLLLNLLQWRLAPALFALLLLFSVLVFRYPLVAYVLGQYIPFCLACLVVALWGMVKNRQTVGGLGLAWAMVRPEVVLLPLLALLLLAWRRRQYRLIGTWVGTTAVVWLVTWLLIGFWELDWLQNIAAYRQYAPPDWPPALAGSNTLAALVVLLGLGWGAWLGRKAWQLPHFSRPAWVVAMAVLLSLLLLPQTGDYTLTLALLPLWLLLYTANGRLLAWLPVLAVMAAPWLVRALALPSGTQLLIIPLLVMGLMAIYLPRWVATLAKSET